MIPLYLGRSHSALGCRCHARSSIDGNKHTAFLAAYVFLSINGLDLVADQVSATTVMLAVAAGEHSEAELADWLRANVQARD